MSGNPGRVCSCPRCCQQPPGRCQNSGGTFQAFTPDDDSECCASGKCEICAPGGFGGSRYWS